MQYIRLILFYSVIFRSVIFQFVIFQSCKFQSPRAPVSILASVSLTSLTNSVLYNDNNDDDNDDDDDNLLYVSSYVHLLHPCLSGVTRGSGVTGVTPEGKKLWANLQRIVEKQGRTGKKGAG